MNTQSNQQTKRVSTAMENDTHIGVTDTLVGTMAALHAGDLSAHVLTQRCLTAISSRPHSGFVRVRNVAAATDAAPDMTPDASAPEATSVNVTSALNDAQARDAQRAAGIGIGLLHGVPIGRKDMYFRDDEPCECGSKILKGYRPAYTATVVERLEAAGAVDLGALHMAEFAMSPTGVNAHLGDGVNPWAQEPHVSGGSSSGSAMAVAQRLIAGALGSDTGGSIRGPAAICGITGIKPTNHLVSIHGVMPLSTSLDCVGFLAQTAQDCARLLSAVVGPDAKDPECIATQTVDYEEDIAQPLNSTMRIAVPQFAIDDSLSAEVHALIEQAVTAFADAGATIVRVPLPDMGELGALANVLCMSEAAAVHAPWLQSRASEYGDQVRRRIERGLLYSGVQYVQAMRLRKVLLARFLTDTMQDCAAVLLPVLPHAVPSIAASSRGTASEVEARFGQLSYWQRGINYLGLPALALPMGFTANGLPNGFQLVGRPLAERTLFRLGHQYQQQTDWHSRRPAL